MAYEKTGKIKARKKITPAESAEILTLRCKGVEQTTIAEIVDRPINSVNRHLQAYTPLFSYLENIEKYRISKLDIFEAAESLSLKSLIDCLARDDSPLAARVAAFRELFTANRLLQDKSTANRTVIQFSIPDQLQALINVTPDDT